MSSPPELLSPAGDWEAMRAAVANGADAVYFGLSNFNARHRAANFTLDELPEVITYLHGHNVRGYVAFNTLIFSDELPEAVDFVRAIAAAGTDAVIVQDLGLALLIHRLCPTLAVHGSTQMTLTEPRGIEFVRELGVERVILARESSTDDIRRIAQGTTMPLEVFVHGALCVSYSGQCLTSEALGGRSANRGQCAQACRLPYDLIVDGQKRPLGDKAYLLSPQDLAAYDLVDDLAGLGVCSLKIEGRLKSAHYVAATTQTYRAAIDAAGAHKPFILSPERERELAQSFSRGFTHGFFDGVNHQELVHARFPKSRGLKVGRVAGKTAQGVVVELWSDRSGAMAQLKPGDGLVFDEGHPEQDEQGGRIFAVRPASAQHRGRMVEVTFGRGDVSLQAVSEGSTVWKTDDPAVRRKLEQSYSREQIARRAPLVARLRAVEGEPLVVTVRDETGREVTVRWEQPLQRAQKFPLTLDVFREQFGRLGDTPFELASVEVDQLGPVMVPKSVLNDLRRQATAQLMALRAADGKHEAVTIDVLAQMRREIQDPLKPGRSASDSECAVPDSSAQIEERCEPETKLYALARTMEQLESLLDWNPPAPLPNLAMIYCEFEDVRRYKDAVPLARSAGIPLAPATMRIVKPHEEGFLRQIADAQPDAVLVRNLGALSFFREHAPALPLIADYAMNTSNELTAGLFASHGVERMVPSYDLNWKQLAAMLRRFDAGRFEAVIHQHMPMFHMEHCVFCHTLSTGTDYRDCGRPCETHKVDLRDRADVGHPLVADAGCRNTVYNGTAQSAAEYVPEMRRLGLRHFRVELLRETGRQARELIERYARVLAGVEGPRAAFRQLRVLSQLGVTRGTLDG